MGICGSHHARGRMAPVKPRPMADALVNGVTLTGGLRGNCLAMVVWTLLTCCHCARHRPPRLQRFASRGNLGRGSGRQRRETMGRPGRRTLRADSRANDDGYRDGRIGISQRQAEINQCALAVALARRGKRGDARSTESRWRRRTCLACLGREGVRAGERVVANGVGPARDTTKTRQARPFSVGGEVRRGAAARHDDGRDGRDCRDCRLMFDLAPRQARLCTCLLALPSP